MKVMSRMIVQLCAAAAMLISFELSWAQSNRATSPATSPSAMSKREKKAALNFEDELVEGATAKPELFYLFQKKNFNYKRLIKLRENFLPEMRSSTEDIQRVRGGN